MKIRALALLIVLALAVPALAQEKAPLKVPAADRLPADTWVLVVWHGFASTDRVRATNTVLRLWHDPEFKPVRNRLSKMFYTEMESDLKKGKTTTTSEDLDDILAIFEKPLVFGLAGNPLDRIQSAKAPAFFGVYNKTGKEALVDKLNKKDQEKANTERTKYTFEGVEVRKSVTTTPVEPEPAKGPEEGKEEGEQEAAPPPEPKVSTSFEATLGEYELFSDEQETIESLITRVKAASAPMESLAGNKVFQAAQRNRAEGTLLETIVLVPDLTSFPIPPNEKFDASAAIRELHMERLHAITFSTGLTADKTLMRGAMLGDTAPGSLFDMIAADTAEFRTPAVAPAGSAFGVIRLDLPALYATLQRAARAGLPPEQAAMADMLDGLVAMQTGLPLTQILGLFTGEVATISTGEEQMMESLPDTFALAVTDGEPVLGLLRTTLAPMIAAEEPVTGGTLLTLTPPSNATAEEGSPAAEPKVFYVAVAPKMLLVSQTRALVDAALGRLASGAPAPAGSIAADPGFQKARKGMGEKVSGFSYGDYTTFPWEKQRATMKKQLAEQKAKLLAEADAAQKGSEEVEPDPERAAELRKQAAQLDEVAAITDALFPLMKRYFHTGVATWRKGADGVFLEGYVD